MSKGVLVASLCSLNQDSSFSSDFNFCRHGLGNRSLGELTADAHGAQPSGISHYTIYLQHPLRAGCTAVSASAAAAFPQQAVVK